MEDMYLNLTIAIIVYSLLLTLKLVQQKSFIVGQKR